MGHPVDLARAKSEFLVNNTYKQKKLNRVMLNGDGNDNGTVKTHN